MHGILNCTSLRRAGHPEYLSGYRMEQRDTACWLGDLTFTTCQLGSIAKIGFFQWRCTMLP